MFVLFNVYILRLLKKTKSSFCEPISTVNARKRANQIQVSLSCGRATTADQNTEIVLF